MCKNSQTLYGTNQTRSFIQVSEDVLNQLLEFNDYFRYVIHVCRILKLAFERKGSPLTYKHNLILKYGLEYLFHYPQNESFIGRN